MRVPLVTLGPHIGEVRDVARGVRLAARPYVERWGTDYLEPEEALRRACALLHPPERADVITWVPGHDGTPGPGYALAAALADRWELPLRECLVRRHEIPSAHSSTTRPSLDRVRASLAVACERPGRVIVADNVIASGANMIGALRTLTAAGWPDLIALSVSVDPAAGSGVHLLPRGGRGVVGRGARCCRSPLPSALMSRECSTVEARWVGR